MAELLHIENRADVLQVTLLGDISLAELPELMTETRQAVATASSRRLSLHAPRTNPADHPSTALLADLHAVATAAGLTVTVSDLPAPLLANLRRLIGPDAAVGNSVASVSLAAVAPTSATGAATISATSGGSGSPTAAVTVVEDGPLADFLPFGLTLGKIGEYASGVFAECQSILQFTGELTLSLAAALMSPSKIRWRETLIYMNRCGNEALPIVMLICFLMGLILGFQAAIQLRVFGMTDLVADLVGMSIVKELGPLMVAMVSTGRAGSAFAAEIGTMKVSEEVDAMVTMGLDPQRFLVVPKVLALMVMMPVLALWGDLCGMLGGLVVGVFKLDMSANMYIRRTIEAVSFTNITEGLIKSLCFALLIAAVGCLRGLQTRGGAQGVGVSTTSAVVSGIFLIILMDSLLTLMFAVTGFGA